MSRRLFGRNKQPRPETGIEEAARLFIELPIEIQDPIGRGDHVEWSPKSEIPTAYDLMGLSPEDLHKYGRVAMLTREWLAAPDPKPRFPKRSGRFGAYVMTVEDPLRGKPFGVG